MSRIRSANSSVAAAATPQQPTTTRALPSASEVDHAEHTAQLVVGLIRRVIDAIRSVDAFAPIPSAARSAVLRGSASGGRPTAANTAASGESALEVVRLMPLLREANVVDDVASTCGATVAQDVSIDDEAALTSSDGERDRREIVSTICNPLLTKLAQCYAVLDLVPQTSPTEDNAEQTKALQQRGGGRRNNAKHKPKPPRGLLSIQDYTDAACMLEFLVCTSILPGLEEDGTILPSPQDRVKLLPKSLGGRLHRKSLLWADAVKMRQCSADSHEANTTIRADKMIELRKSAQTIGFVVALERFRPMLLPRHADDIMAALFQSDRYQELLSAEVTEGKAPTSTSHTAMLNIFLAGRGPQSVQVAIDSQSVQLQVVDPHTRARAYQTLLSGGTKTPQWLRRRVGSLLNSLAASNLRCVVDVFVVAASSMPTDDIAAASARLGRVLCSVPIPSATEVVTAAKDAGRSTNAQRYYQRLFQQLALLLDIASASNMAASNCRKGDDAGDNFDPRIVAGVLTVWAVIDNLPHHMLERFAIPMLANGLVPLQSIGTNSNNMANNGGGAGSKRPPVRISVRRILSLFSFAPKASMGLVKIYHLLLSPLQVDINNGTSQTNDNELAGNATAIGQLVRVAAAGDDNVVERSRVVQDALLALRLLVHGMASGDATATVSIAGMTGREVLKALSLGLVEAVCINPMDVMGLQYKQALEDGKHDVILYSKGMNGVEIGDLAQDMGSRAKVVVVDIVAKLFGSSELKKTAGGKDESGAGTGSDLPNVLFCLLLLLYFGNVGSSRGGFDTFQLLPKFLRRNLDSAKLAAMSMLPLCCEYCSPAVLVLGQSPASGGNGEETFGVLAMIRLVITSVASRQQATGEESSDSDIEKITPIRDEGPASFKCMDYSNCDLSATSFGVFTLQSSNTGVDKSNGEERKEERDESSEDAETLLSIGSIVVSLLVAMLELGEERRLPKEEEILSSLLPGLQVLSSPVGGGAEDTLSRLESEIAEMASHALALIHSRGAMDIAGGKPPSTVSQTDTVQEKIGQAEQDLRSDQPPIRARGVVTLRHVARGFIDQQGSDRSSPSPDNISKPKPLIVEIEKNITECDEENNQSPPNILEQLVRICVETLQDSESYVYLAAIQTLVAIADANAAKVMPLLAQAVSLGHVDFASAAAAIDTALPPSDGGHDLTLSPLQRIKTTEALLFAIKRRGEGVFVYGNDLMEMMLFGCRTQAESKKATGSIDARSAATRIQGKTETFFIGERNDEEDIDVNAEEEERRLRINTGGPVFDTEENDTVRAGCISIVAELVAALPPTGLARYCPTLVELGKQVLRLDASRPMRRSAALLCSELYSVVVREFDDASTSKGDNNESFLSFATAMVSCDEDAMHATLQRCLSADDVDIVTVGTGDDGNDGNDDQLTSTIAGAVKGKLRLADPASMARCQEALETRASIEEVGIWAAARVLVASYKANQNSKDDPATRAILQRLRETKKQRRNGSDDTADTVQAMRGLRIDGDSLKFM